MNEPTGDDHPSRSGDADLDQIRTALAHLTEHHSQLSELLDAVIALSANLDVKDVLRTLVETGQRLVHARYGALGLHDEHGGVTGLLTSGPGMDHYIEDAAQLPRGGGLIGELVRTARPLRSDDIPHDPRAVGFPPDHPVMKTLLGVPIRVRGKVYGNLYLTDKDEGPFSDDDENVLTALASAAAVTIENAHLYRRLHSATEDFQRRLLPELPSLDLCELDARYEPSSQAPRIGGDWYDVVRLPGGALCVMVGDVMGHDVHASSVMSRISNMLRLIAFTRREPPSMLLGHLDGALHELHDGPMATVLLARLEPDENGGRRLCWSSAGHVPPLVAVPGQGSRYLDGEADPPLGVDPELPRTDYTHDLPPGATIVLHTDGLVERRGHHLHEGMDDTAAITGAHASHDLRALCDALMGRLQGSFEDDVALLAARLR
ncbi:SpoIIE family protein phosphatase [Actinomadura rayongensis]|uniref:SpoIIE family protein phosphatase n=1 Tax=Actinomadura rayongensis TaxID=1429076 RepID=A0A6I4W7B2_9ACTN|nr:SpoIIE family protein phosphatase [Actinomadura rayongensis]